MTAASGGYLFIRRSLLLLLLYGCMSAVQSQTLTVITRPEALITSSGNVVEGSVIQVYCTVENNNDISFTWTLNGTTLLNDPPHIRIRTNIDGTDTTSVLTVDNFRDTDNGVYQCTATDTKSMAAGNGTAVSLTAVDSIPDGTLMIVSGPSDNEPVEVDPLLNDNRTGIALGGTVDGSLLTCVAGHQGDGVMNYSPPSVVWVRNGQPVDDTDSRITITPTTMANGQLSNSLTITNFGLSDVGVYQCVFTDSELITTVPYRLDTGNTITIERVSSAVIILRPPEKLVIEVKTSGEYQVHFWRKNENIFGSSGNFQVMLPDEFPNFAEIFVRDNTIDDDLGIYRVLPTLGANAQTYAVVPDTGVEFAVIAPEDANTTALTLTPIVILEGGSADISCISVGAPAPSITWELDNQIVSFEQTDTVTQFEATLTGTEVGQRGTDVTPGNIISDLHIVSARYPAHDGVYTCIGTNSDDLNVASSSATVAVQVRVIPEVEITAAFTRVNLGENLMLNCSVIRGNPTNYNYSIVHIDTMTTTTGPTRMLTGIQESDLGTYRCDVSNDAGTGSANITIELGVPPTVTAVQLGPVVVNTTVDLVCIVTAGDLPIDIVWERDGGSEIVFMGNDTTGGNTTIMIGDGDYGTYTCTGTNRLGMDSVSVEVVRAVGPTLPDDQSVEVVTVTSLSLTVNITGFNLPLTDITWLIDGVIATDVTGIGGNITITNTSTDTSPATSTFVLDSVQLPIESGLYSVVATNDAGNDMSIFNVTVTSPPVIDFPIENVSISVTESNDTSFICSARGFPAPNFTWYRGSELVDGSNLMVSPAQVSLNSTSGFYEVTSELSISMADRTDAGMYRCVASNIILGETVEDSRVFDLTVNFSVTIRGEPTGDTVIAPTKVELNCRADGVPTPTISWIKTLQNGSVFEYFMSSGNLNITEELDGLNQTSTLTIEPTSALDSANYSCRAMNGFGQRESEQTEVIVFVGAQIDFPVEGQQLRANMTEDFFMTCSASGIPSPSIFFFRGNESLNDTNGQSGMGMDFTSRVQLGEISMPVLMDDGTLLVTRSLTLTNAVDEDSGNLTCQATNTIIELNETRMDMVMFELIVQVAATITSPPANISVVAPDSAIFSCTAEGVPIPDITWIRIDDGAESEIILDNSTQINNTPMSDRVLMSTLTFSETQPLNSAMYRCVASNLLGSENAVAQFTVNDLPEIIVPVENFNYTVDEGLTVTFVCSASGIPAPTITWFSLVGNMPSVLNKDVDSRVSMSDLLINENYEPSDGRGTVFLVTSRLTLSGSNDSDSGTYSCQAENEFGNATREFERIVRVAPMIVTPPVDVIAVESIPGLYTFQCLATGRPRPTITWLFVAELGAAENTVMDVENTTTITDTEIGDRQIMSTLSFSVVALSDAGMYICSAENDFRNSTVVTAAATLTVYVIPVVTSVYPEVNQMSYIVDEGNSVIFECTATGVPAPEVTWLKDGVELNSTSDPRITFGAASDPMDDRETVLEVTRNLTLANTVDEDSGSYVCMATNMAGNDNDTFEVIVQVAPVITTPPLNSEVTEQESVLFICEATGRPRPGITWYKADNSGLLTTVNVTDPRITVSQVEDGKRRIMSNLTLDSVLPSDSATYVCSAENEVAVDGETRANASLTVNVVPVIPEVNQMNYTVDEGNSVTFECTATGIPALEITWLRDGVELNSTSDPRITFGAASDPMDFSRDDGETVLEVTRNLTLANTVDEDSGSYVCMATNVAGKCNYTFEVIVQVAPVITTPPMDLLEAVDQESVLFICEATGRPRPRITWYKHDDSGQLTVIDVADSRITVSEVEDGEREIMSNLTLNSVLPSDSATYVCSAENEVAVGGVVRENATLTVNVVPVVISVYPDGQLTYTVNEGNSVTFECTATGIPDPEIIWRKNGMAFNSSVPRVTIGSMPTIVQVMRDSDNETVFEVTQTLTLNTTMDSDSGMYECVAMNNVGQDSSFFELIVQVAPTITQSPVDVTNTEGAVAVFVCTATGLPRPEFSWYFLESGSGNITQIFNSTQYNVSSKDESDDRGITGTLMVLATVPSDTGVYRCVATNVVSMTGQDATLTVHVTPAITSVYPEVDQMNYTVNEGDSVTFECVATGIPAPGITWLRDGVELSTTSDNRVMLGNVSNPIDFVRMDDEEVISQVTRSLTLADAMDSDSAATYTCVASNAAMPGIVMINFSLVVQVAPVIELLQPEQQTIISPNDGVYNCQAIARPRPSITWYRVESDGNRTVLTNTNKYTISVVIIPNRERQLNSFLRVTSTAPSDTAVYVCEATNVVSTTEGNVSLTVHVRPEITALVPGGRFVVNQTNPVTFVCAATGIPAPTIQWYRGNMSLNGTNSRITINDTVSSMPFGDVASVGSSLSIDSTLGSDSGTYRCVATNNLINMNDMEIGIDEENVTLFVQVPPVVVPLDSDQKVIANESTAAVLSFRIDNAAPPVSTSNIRWFYSPNQPLTLFAEGNDFQEITNLMNRTSESTLEFTNGFLNLTIGNIVQARPENLETDTGRYFLQATNEAGVNSSFIDLVVFGPPLITDGPVDQFIINNGSSAVFTCGAQAFPEHNISWTFTNFNGTNETIISTVMTGSSSKYLIVDERNNSRFGELTVMNVKFGDRGVYTCSAANEVGTVMASANLTVHVVPVIVETSGLTEVNINSPAVLVCLATGYPVPTISWRKDGEEVSIYDDNTLAARLDIIEFAPEYMDVNSTGGSGFQSSGYMGSGSVLGLLNMYTDTTVDQILGLGELGVVSLLSFEETVRGDTANYTCIATNALPETTTLMDVSGNIPLVILERPDSPVNVTAFNFGARWVALRWTPTFDGNRPVTSFTLYINSVDVSDNFTLIGSQNASDLMTSEGRFMYNISDMAVILPFTNYSFTVVSCNEIGCSDQSAPSAVIETAEDRPDAAPTLIDTFSPSSTSLYLSWTPPPVDLHRGILIGYQIVYRNLDVPGSNEMVTTTTDASITLEGLGKFSNYSVSVSAGTIVGYGPEDVTTFRTLNDTSSSPLSIMLTLDFNVRSTITVTWLEPSMPNGIITHYNVHFTGSKSYNTTFTHVNSSQSAVGELGSGSDFQTTLTDLFPGTVYEITVSAINGAGEGVSASETIATTSAPPVPPSVPPSVLPPNEQINQDPRTITIDVPNFSTAMGQISHYHIIVVFLPAGTNINDLSAPDTQFNSRGSLKNINLPCDNKPAGVSAYITAEMSNTLYGGLNGKYVVGQDKDSDSNSPNDRPELYTNGPLCYSTRYTFFVRAYPVSTNTGMGRRAARQTTGPSRQYMEFSSSSYTGTPSTTPVAPVDPIPIAVAIIIIIIVLVVIVVVLVVVAVVVVRRRRVYVYKTTREDTDNNVHFNEGVKLIEYRPPDEGAVTRHPIPVTALPSHLERMHTNENCGFGEEYRIIQDNSPRKPVDICVSPENKPKNRYANIQCFDHTRVTLTPIEGAEHDYINANFIDGYNREREYIAAQGPLPDTLGDFWRMVWDYNITNIVMLTNLVEKMKIKCSQYWPNSNSQQYANIVVTIVNTVSHADFVIRYFHIKKVNSEEVREIRQFHFVSWPDFGVPRHATPLLHFLRRVRNVHPYKSEQPLLIHCSAGVGRTGTLTTIDVELQRAMQENVVDPFNFVIGMRQQRNHMVQTEAQYVYLHDAILEGVTSGATEVQVDRLGQKFAELEKVDAEGESGFLKEYSRLRQFKVNVKEFTDANDEANKFKNRLANALPYNYNRVHLQMSPGVGGSDYINASFVDGYAQKGTYIATQGPLANTVDDFWRMIWEKEVHVIVMLTQLEEKGKELCALYWPDSLNCPEKMGSLSIEVVNEQPFEDYILRELKVTDVTDTENKFRIIKQYHFTAWPSDGAPTSGAGMIDLIGQVTRTQLHTGNKPIVVHCSAGIGRTGAFCALSSSIERVKTEGIVDVFHCIKHLRTQRPHMVQSVEQYAFCYAAIREYVDSLNSYSNFQ